MGIRNVLPPEHSPTPLMSLERARAAGLDVSKIRTCAVPQKAGDVFIVKGCSCAEKCSQDGFGLVHLGEFGPKPGMNGGAIAGQGGQGPENVPYYCYDAPSRTEKEDFMPCYSWFMSSMHDKYEQQRNTGDVIEVLGREKDTKIVQLEVLPVDKNANKTGDSRMSEIPKPIIVPGYRQTDGASARMDYALMIRRNRQQQAIASRGGRMGPGPANASDYDEAADHEGNTPLVPEPTLEDAVAEAVANDEGLVVTPVDPESGEDTPTSRRVDRPSFGRGSRGGR